MVVIVPRRWAANGQQTQVDGEWGREHEGAGIRDGTHCRHKAVQRSQGVVTLWRDARPVVVMCCYIQQRTTADTRNHQ